MAHFFKFSKKDRLRAQLASPNFPVICCLCLNSENLQDITFPRLSGTEPELVDKSTEAESPRCYRSEVLLSTVLITKIRNFKDNGFDSKFKGVFMTNQ